MQNENSNEIELSSTPPEIQILKTENPAPTKDRRKSLIASIICTSLSLICVIGFVFWMVLLFSQIHSASDAGEAVGSVITLIVLYIYLGTAMSILILGLSIASIITSSFALKSSNKKYRTFAIVNLAISCILIVAVIVCIIITIINAGSIS